MIGRIEIRDTKTNEKLGEVIINGFGVTFMPYGNKVLNKRQNKQIKKMIKEIKTWND